MTETERPWDWNYDAGPDPERPRPPGWDDPQPAPFDPEAARLVLACPHRTKGENGCQPHACAALRGDGCGGRFTSWSNCLACVRSSPTGEGG